MLSSAASGACAHCGEPLADSADEYCCAGCRTVAHLIASSGLGRYYALRGDASGGPVTLDARRDRQWLEPITAELAAAAEPVNVELDIQGMHCAACVWLTEELFRRTGDGIDIIANPALGRLSLRVQPTFDIPAFVDDVERFGYRLGPPLKSS